MKLWTTQTLQKPATFSLLVLYYDIGSVSFSLSLSAGYHELGLVSFSFSLHVNTTWDWLALAFAWYYDLGPMLASRMLCGWNNTDVNGAPGNIPYYLQNVSKS